MDVSYGLCTLALRDADGIPRFSLDWLGAPVGSEDERAGGGDPAESVQPFGFRSVPQDAEVDPNGEPIPTRACGLLFFDDGGESFAWPTQDPRYRLALPELPKGSAELYAGLAAGTVGRLTISGADGSIKALVPAGRYLEVVAGGVNVLGSLTAGVVDALDPGVAPAPVAIAGPVATFAAACSAMAAAVGAYAAAGAVVSPLTAPAAGALAAAVATFTAAATALTAVYPAGMTATRLSAR